MAKHNNIGAWGEQQAVDWLAAQGYSIIYRNQKHGGVEVDAVALKGAKISFVEIKTRSNDEDDPTLAVDLKKAKRLCRAADWFVTTYDIKADPQIDLICVTGSPDEGVSRIEYYPDIYLPGSGVVIDELPGADD